MVRDRFEIVRDRFEIVRDRFEIVLCGWRLRQG